MFPTLNDFLITAEQNLIQLGAHFGHGTDNAWDEACGIASFVLGLPHDVDESVLSRQLTPFESEKLYNLLKLRIENAIPLPYLSHTAWFGGYPFYVNRQVLIPRSPLFEPILEEFQPFLRQPPKKMLDLCTGSGCIAVLLAKVFPNASIDAIDIDDKALSVAKINVVRHGVYDQIRLIQSDLFSKIKNEKYDIIISNPPYIASDEMNQLPREYRYEPKLALEAGQDGLFIVNQILEEAPKYLENGGLLIVEVGNSADAVIKNYPNLPFIWLEFERGGEGVFLLIKGEETWCTVS